MKTAAACLLAALAYFPSQVAPDSKELRDAIESALAR